MLNLLTKTKPWMVASLIVASSLFGQNNAPCPKPCPPKPCPKPCPQPCPPTQVCPQDPCCPTWPTPVLNAAYNYPARIQTRCPWDLYGDVSFIYWQPIQENMELGLANTTAAVRDVLDAVTANVINMNFKFKPGFKIGLGGSFSHDNWDTLLEYTWAHNTNSQSSDGPSGGNIIPMIGAPASTGDSLYSSVSENWRLKMGIIDLDLGRWYYVGTNLMWPPQFWCESRLDPSKTGVQWGSAPPMKVKSTANQALGRLVLWLPWIPAGTLVAASGSLETPSSRFLLHEVHRDCNTTNSYERRPHSDSMEEKQSHVYAIRPHFDLELHLAGAHTSIATTGTSISKPVMRCRHSCSKTCSAISQRDHGWQQRLPVWQL